MRKMSCFCSITSLLLLIIVSSTYLPSETAAIDLGIYNYVLKILTSAPELSSSVKKVYCFVKQKAPELSYVVFDFVKQKTPELIYFVRDVFDFVVKNVFNFVKQSTQIVFDFVKQKTPELIFFVKDVFDFVTPKLISFVKNVFDYLEQKRQIWFHFVKQKTPELISGVKEGFSFVKPKLISLAENVFSSAKVEFEFVKTKLTSIVKNVFDYLEQKRQIWFDFVKQKTPELISGVKDGFDFVKPNLISVAENVFNSAKVMLEFVKTKLISIVNVAIDSVEQNAPEMIPLVKNVLNSAKQKSPEESSPATEVFDSVKEKTPDLSSVKDIYKTLHSYDLSSAVEETAKRYLPDGLNQIAAKCAKFAAEEVFSKLLRFIPGGGPIYGIVSKHLQGSELDPIVERLEVQQEEIKKLHAKLSRLEKEGSGCTCSCRNLQEHIEIQKPEQCQI